MRRIFSEGVRDSELLDKGYFVDSLLSSEQVRQCLQLYYDSDSLLKDKFYNTLASPDKSHRRKINDELERLIGQTINSHFHNYKVLAYNFAIKHPGDGGTCDLHNDDWHANEELYTCVNVWIPLVDVNKENGSLQILPNSHKLPYPLRGIGLPFAYEQYDHLIKPRMKVMEMKAGEALFFHSRIIHGSDDNKTSSLRPAIILAMLPTEARPEVYLQHSDLPKEKAELFEAPTNFYLETEISQRPDGFNSLGIFDYIPPAISDSEFIAIIDGK